MYNARNTNFPDDSDVWKRIAFERRGAMSTILKVFLGSVLLWGIFSWIFWRIERDTDEKVTLRMFLCDLCSFVCNFINRVFSLKLDCSRDKGVQPI